MSRDNPELAHYFNEIKPEFLEAVRRVLNTVSTWNETKRAKVSVEFCGVMAGVDSFLLALVRDKPQNVPIALSRSPRKIAVTKLFVRQVSDGAETEAEAIPKIEALWQTLRTSPDVAAALEALRAPRSEEVAAVENRLLRHGKQT